MCYFRCCPTSRHRPDGPKPALITHLKHQAASDLQPDRPSWPPSGKMTLLPIGTPNGVGYSCGPGTRGSYEEAVQGKCQRCQSATHRSVEAAARFCAKQKVSPQFIRCCRASGGFQAKLLEWNKKARRRLLMIPWFIVRRLRLDQSQTITGNARMDRRHLHQSVGLGLRWSNPI
jgi:hypothetical protein